MVNLMKKWHLIIVVIIVAVIIIAAVFGYQQVRQRQALEDIQISFAGVSIESISLTSVSLNFTLRMTNPSTTNAVLDRTDYTVFINNFSLGSGQNLEQVTIPAGGSVLVPQPFILSNSGAIQGIWNAILAGQVDWRLVGIAYFDLILFTVSVPYEFSGTWTR
jgi:LEA14-like dessication related protein